MCHSEIESKPRHIQHAFFFFCRSGKPHSGFSLHQPISSDVRYHNGDHPPHHPNPSVGLSSLNVYGTHHNQQPQTITHTSASGFELHGDVAPTPPPRRAPSSVNASPQHRTTPTVHRCFGFKPLTSVLSCLFFVNACTAFVIAMFIVH